jgi:hypothetical protein
MGCASAFAPDSATVSCFACQCSDLLQASILNQAPSDLVVDGNGSETITYITAPIATFAGAGQGGSSHPVLAVLDAKTSDWTCSVILQSKTMTCDVILNPEPTTCDLTLWSSLCGSLTKSGIKRPCSPGKTCCRNELYQGSCSERLCAGASAIVILRPERIGLWHWRLE